MPQYSQEEAAGLLGQMLVKTNERLDKLEARPTQDRFARGFENGRRLAEAKGYRGKRLEELEGFMSEHGIARHDFAMRLQPEQPTDMFAGVQDDPDFKALIDSGGQDETATRRLINTALKEVRSDSDY